MCIELFMNLRFTNFLAFIFIIVMFYVSQKEAKRVYMLDKKQKMLANTFKIFDTNNDITLIE